MKALASLMPSASEVTMVDSPLLSVTRSEPRLVSAIDADNCAKPARLISA